MALVLDKPIELPKVSDVGFRVLDVIAREACVVDEIVDEIKRDPVLVTHLIRYANSPKYRRAAEISNLKQAVNVLGFHNVRNAVVVQTMRVIVSEQDETNRRLWNHSVGISIMSRLVAMRFDASLADDVELFGLLHDLGTLVLYSHDPQAYMQLVERADEEELPMDALEREAFGMTGSDVLEKIADNLRLPQIMVQALSNFHGRALEGMTQKKDEYLAVVSLAHHLEQMMFSDLMPIPETIPTPQADLLPMLGMIEDDLQDILEDYTEIYHH